MRLLIFLLILSLTMAARADSMDEKFAALPAGVSLLGPRGLDEFAITGSAGSVSRVEVAGQPFTQAARIVTRERPANAYSFQFSAKNAAAVKVGDVLLGVFWARAVEPLPADGEAKTEFCFELGQAPHTKITVSPATLSTEWRRYYAPGEAKVALAAGEGGVRFRLGYDPQTVEIADVRLLAYGSRVKFADLPFTSNTYNGRDPQAPWRAEAAARIDQLRKGDLTVTVFDAAKKPVPGARVAVRMKRHAFGFGSAVDAKLLLATSPDADKYREIVARDFNKVTIENHLKWPMWEGDRKIGTRAVAWLRERGIAVRGHCLYWGSEKHLPKRVVALFDQPEALRTAVLDHIADIGGAFKGQLPEWDVVNEPFSNFAMQNVFAGRGASAGRIEPELGAQSLAEWFRAAHTVDPAAQLFINDYSILSTGGVDYEHQAYYERTIQELLRLGAPVQGIGMQGHFQEDLTPIPRLFTILDRFAKFGLPIQITEHDFTTWDEQLQADYTRDFMTAMFSHANVSGFLIWGFWEKAHWIPAAAYYRADWSQRPAGKAWRDLVFRDWWTNANGVAAADGTFKTRGFLGDYEIEVESGGKKHVATARIGPAGTKVAVEL
jgi:GH35 family endo-1,4-beta-xylanase